MNTMERLFISEITLNKLNDIDYSAYPFSLPVVKNMGCLRLNNRVTFFAGENGTGKSTLLEAIAVNYGFNPEGGSKNFNFSTMPSHSELHKYITLIKGVRRPKDGYFLRAESFYNLATEIENIDPALKHAYGGKSLHAQSHGESFLSLMINRFYGDGLYILDEPEAALSPTSQMALLARIYELEKLNSQFIIATHSPILLAYPDAQIFVLSEENITPTPYMETEHYIVTKRFINNPYELLTYLID